MRRVRSPTAACCTASPASDAPMQPTRCARSSDAGLSTSARAFEMAGGFAIFQPSYDFVDGKLDTFLTQDAGKVMALVSGPLRAALVLYVLLYGFAILRGAIQEPLIDFAIRSLQLALTVTLATTPAYGTWISTPLFHTLPDTLSSAISGHAPDSAGSAFDDFFSTVAYLRANIAAHRN